MLYMINEGLQGFVNISEREYAKKEERRKDDN